ncbi:MAG TPA: DUF6701 domain-containing protein [Caldimonas sp.]|jgi:MSHA biogenesis protein MshQ|nr:DUF6701 domain-containing protein [Caldimonas sp.]
MRRRLAALAALAVALLLAPVLALASSAGFVGFDSFTGGSWKGVYGSDGYQVVNDSQSLPSYATVTPTSTLLYTWAGSTNDPRGAQKAASPTDRIAACWYSSTTFSLSVTISDGQTHQVAIYALDWDNYYGRSETIEIRDAATNALLDSRSLAGFQGGIWAVWNVSGNVNVVVVNTNGPSNAVVSGIFFAPVQAAQIPPQSSSQATFIRADTTTQGTWKGVYGSDGYTVVNDAQSLPSYATLAPASNLIYTWAGSTSDVRGLQKATSATDRIAACWYSSGAYRVNVRISDGQVHSLALYALDWDNYHSRTETIEIRDTGTNALLDSRDLATFQGGTWLVWNIAGNVTIVVRNTNAPANAVVSGLFFGPPQSPPNLIVNGSFEVGATTAGNYVYGPTDQPPWTWGSGAGVTGAGSAFTSGNTGPTEGRLGAFLQNTGAVTQTFTATTAGSYAAYLRIVNRGNYGGQQSFAVDIDGTTVLAAPVPASPIASTWMYVATPTFALTAGSHTIAIRGSLAGPDSTAFIDEVRLTAATAFASTAIAGSFEEWQIGAQNYHYNPGAQPWQFPLGSGITANNSAFGSPTAPQGAQAAFVQNGGYMTQTWTDAGNGYQLQFSAAGRTAYGVPTLTATIDGATLGSWTLNNTGYATFSAPVTLAAGPHTVRFASAGGDSFVDDVRLVAAAAPTTAGGFNAFESGTAAGSIAGVIHTKVAGAPFAIDVVVLNAARDAVMTAFTGNVKVELLDASDSSGALDAGGCRASWPVLPGGAAATLAFAGADNGRKAATLSEANAWRDLRVRISAPSSGVATTVACSGDDFANRPASFAAFAASDADSASAGTTRALANATATGGNVHQAGRPFTVHAAAVNAGGATTTNYVGTATPQVAACAGSACVGTAGTLTLTATAVAGVIDRSASYDESGSIALQLVDSSFAAVDAGDGSSAAERTIASPTIAVGRFVPDRFDLVALAAPTLRTFGGNACAARSFTYVGQPFGYAAAPQATVHARNAAGATTANYSGVLWKLATATQAWAALPATPAFDTTAATLPALTSNNNGSGLVAAQASDRLRFTRPTNAPVAPFDAAIALTWSVRDTSEAAVPGNPTIASAPLVFANMAFDAGTQFRYGVLRLVPAYGSELVDLPVLVEAQYWDGVRLATHSADQCTAVPTTSVAFGNYQRNLSACKTALATAAPTLASGRAFLRLAKPGNGNGGSVDLGLQLGASAAGQTCAVVGAAPTSALAANLPWLQGKWSGAAAFDQNPVTRASFGQYRSPLIYQRESY